MNLPDIQKVCVLVKGNVELWITPEQQVAVEVRLNDPSVSFLKINGQTVNRYEIAGIFDPASMDERRRRANGQWTCQYGKWHDKASVCEHTKPRMIDVIELGDDGVPRVVGQKEIV